MVLDRLIGSRIQHADPRIRIAALAKLEATDPLLAEVASADADSAVRRAAIERLCDLEALRRAADSDVDAGNREQAAARLGSVLAGPESGPPSMDARTTFIAAHASTSLASFLAEHAAPAAVRGAALARTDDETVLSRIASHDPSAELRRAALARVESDAALERIEHDTRTHDHGISRAARLRLQERRSARAGHDDAEAMCERMAALAAGTASAADEAAFHRIEQAWNARRDGGAPTAEITARYEGSRDAFRALLAQHARARAARSPVHSERQALLADLQHARELDQAAAQSWVEKLAQTQAAWDATPDQDPGETQRFTALGAEIEAHISRLERAHREALPLRSLIAELRGRIGSDAPTPSADLAALEERAQRVHRPEDAEAARTLEHELGALLERLRQKERRDSEVAADALATIRKAVEEVEAALGRGELAAALPSYDDAQRRLQALDPKARGTRQLRQRLQKVAPRLQELRDWQRWGIEQTRTGLCVEAEGLIASAEAPEQLARRIRNLRREWQSLDRASATTSKSLWDRFDRACTAAYAPCAAHFTEQRTARAANLERKQALLERLETLDRDTDWNAPDWRALERTFRNTEREWHMVGPVDRSLAKSLAERHGTVRQQLEGRFGPRREAELERRKAVIADLKALAESAQLAGAVARVREAQSQWTPTVSARRSVEQALWTEFRAACDAVFARMNALRSAAVDQQRAAAHAGGAACERIEALAQRLAEPAQSDVAAIGSSVEEGRAELARLRREYTQAPRPARNEEAQLNARFKAACTAVERAIAVRREALGRLELEACATRARLCRELEHRILRDGEDAGVAAFVDELSRTWVELPRVSGPAGEAIERRFAVAAEAARSGEHRTRLAKSLAEQTAEKRRLCLRFEIVAGVPSPPEHDGARLSYRAQWMQESMRGLSQWPATEREKLDEARRIEARWHALGASPQAEDERLEARYQAALSALRQGIGSVS